MNFIIYMCAYNHFFIFLFFVGKILGQELTEFPIMCIGAEKEIKRYVPPRTGTLTLVVVDGFTQKETYRVLSASDRNYINEIARQSGDLLTMTTYGVQSYRIRFNEAMGVAETLLKENSNRVEILSRILPQMASAADARMVVAKLLNNSKTDIQKLRREIGFALKPMLGNNTIYLSLQHFPLSCFLKCKIGQKDAYNFAPANGMQFLCIFFRICF